MRLRVLLRVEAVLASITTALAILTIVSRDWIELITGWDPDRGDRTFEIAFVLALVAISIVLTLAARRAYRRRVTAPAG